MVRADRVRGPGSGTASHAQIELFVRENERALMGLAYTLTGTRQEAEDVVQSVLLRLVSRDLSTVDDLSAYARRAICNEVTSLSRRLITVRRRRRDLVAEWERRLRGQPDPYGRVEVLSALAKLPRRQRAAVVLRYYVDLSDAEIADALDCKPATVRSLLSRAIHALRQDLEDQL